MENKQIYILRHGETEWSKSGQHTGLTDIPLIESGVSAAKLLKKRIDGIQFSHVFTSPLLRAKDTAKICGFGDATLLDELLEWNYGEYEGKKTLDIRKEIPDWNIFTHGGAGGESVQEISSRADRLIEKLLPLNGPIALYTSGHISRAIAARWIEQPVTVGKHLILSTASLSILDIDRGTRVLRRWNDTSHIDKMGSA